MYLFIKSFKFRLFKVDFIGYIRAYSVLVIIVKTQIILFPDA